MKIGVFTQVLKMKCSQINFHTQGIGRKFLVSRTVDEGYTCIKLLWTLNRRSEVYIPGICSLCSCFIADHRNCQRLQSSSFRKAYCYQESVYLACSELCTGSLLLPEKYVDAGKCTRTPVFNHYFKDLPFLRFT